MSSILKKIISTSDQVSKEKEYWINKLAGATRSCIAYDYPNGHSGEFEKETITLRLSDEIIQKLSSVANQSLNN
jgi:hypothetical protein